MTPTFPLTTATDPTGLQRDTNPIQNLALGLCMVDFVIFFSRFFDEFSGGYHLPGIILLLLTVTSFASGKLFQGFSNKVSRFMLAFVGWVTLASLFSIWRSYSIPSYEALLLALLYFSIIAGVVTTFRHIRRIICSLAFSFLIAALLMFVFSGAESGERYKLAIGTYHDPNQYAMCLLMGIPLWWFIAATSQKKLTKVFCYLCTVPMFVVFFQTGSRAGVLGLFAVIILEFLSASVGKKLVLLSVTVIGVILVISVMPSYIKLRYETFFDSSTVDLNNQSAESAFLLKGDMDSAKGRQALLVKSIQITLQHPIFGVGPGNFPTAVFSEAKENGDHFAWFVTHNAYTQVSSETGIPGLILFVSILICSVKNLSFVLRATGPQGSNPWPDMWKAAKYVRLTLAGTCVCIFFLSVGFTPEVYILAGLSVALERVMRQEMARAVPVASPEPPPMVAAGFKLQPRFAEARYSQESRWAGPRS